MTEHELRMQYLILEDNYRKLENRVAELELNLKLNKYLGLEEKVTNTSISLFLLRRDREKLSNDLGISVSDYASVKSFGEEALEHLIYEYSDVLDDFKHFNTNESIEDDINIYNEVAQQIANEDVINNSTIEVNIGEPEVVDSVHNLVENKEVEDKEENNLVNEEVIKDKEVNLVTEKVSDSVIKKPAKRGRKPKSEKQTDKPVEKEIEIKVADKSNEEDMEFENLDDALNMWA